MSFTCPRCGFISYHPKDAEERYCVRCHVFVDDPAPSPAFPPPRLTGAPPRPATLTGRVFPAYADGQPVLLSMPGSGAFYLPCFTEVGDLHEVLARAGVGFEGIKQIEDGVEFLDSVPPHIEVVVDLRWVEDPGGGRRLRFGRVLRD